MGFRKAGRTWRLASRDVVQVLNLQKSPWGPAPLYVNLGVYVRRLGSKSSPAVGDCHLQVRLERVASAAAWNAICTLSANAAPPEDAVHALLEDGVGWLNAVATGEGRQAFLVSPQGRHALVYKALRQAATGA